MAEAQGANLVVLDPLVTGTSRQTRYVFHILDQEHGTIHTPLIDYLTSTSMSVKYNLDFTLYVCFLVGGVNPSEKYASQFG